MFRFLLYACLMASFIPTQAQPWSSGRPDGHAPIGVMGDHTHGAGEFMISYRFMYMEMSGSRDGTTSISEEQVLDDFMVTPTDMPMTMHMLGLMYAPTDALTMMAMVPAVSSSMDHVTRAGGMFTTEASGLGDVSLAALLRIATPDRQRVHANLGVSFPTGSIEEMDVTPMSDPNETLLPYPMQTGSGTIDMKPGLTYLGQTDSWSWGGQASATLRLGHNDQDYRLGNVYGGTLWGARKIGEAVSASVRAEGRDWGNIDGASPLYEGAVAGMMVPTVFPNLRAGRRLDVAAGFNVLVPQGLLEGLRLAAEASMPVYQSLDGPQLETDFQLVVGFQYAPPH